MCKNAFNTTELHYVILYQVNNNHAFVKQFNAGNVIEVKAIMMNP